MRSHHTVNQVFLCLLMLLLANCGANTELSDYEIDKAGQQIPAESFKEHLSILADDKTEGREPGSDGYQLSADYVAQKYREMSLEPGGDSTSYFQTVPMRASKLIPDSARITLVRGNKKILRYAPGAVGNEKPGCNNSFAFAGL